MCLILHSRPRTLLKTFVAEWQSRSFPLVVFDFLILIITISFLGFCFLKSRVLLDSNVIDWYFVYRNCTDVVKIENEVFIYTCCKKVNSIASRFVQITTHFISTSLCSINLQGVIVVYFPNNKIMQWFILIHLLPIDYFTSVI